MRRAAILLACVHVCALSALWAADEKRARTATPGRDYVAPDVHSMGHVLNGHLRRLGPSFSDCSDFDEASLRSRQRRLAELVDAELVAIYPAHDKRRLRHAADIEPRASLEENLHLQMVKRDGLCHEVVLALVHHLNATARERVLLEGERYPLLPTTHHARSTTDATPASAAVFDEYERQVSCQVCHTTASSEWPHATMPTAPPPPPPVTSAAHVTLPTPPKPIGGGLPGRLPTRELNATPPLWGGARRWASFAINLTSFEVSTDARPWLFN